MFDKEALAQNAKLVLTANGCILTEDVVSPALIQMVYSYDGRDPRLKTCLYHRALLKTPITGHAGGDPVMQDGLRERIGLRTIVSAVRGAGNKWRKQSERDSIPQTEETRRAFKTITPEERDQFPDLGVVRVPCCFRVHPKGWCVCCHCDAVLQLKGELMPAAPGNLNELTKEGSLPVHAAMAVKGTPC